MQQVFTIDLWVQHYSLIYWVPTVLGPGPGPRDIVVKKITQDLCPYVAGILIRGLREPPRDILGWHTFHTHSEYHTIPKVLLWKCMKYFRPYFQP